MKIPDNSFLVNRKLLHSDLWLAERFTRGQAWVDMFGLANHASGHIRVRGILVEIKRGQLGYSHVALAKRWRWSRGKVLRFLNELEKTENIVQQTGHVTSIISICNYDYWQGKLVQQVGQQTVQQTDSKRYTNNEEIMNDNKENIIVHASLRSAVDEFVKHRKKLRKPLTDRGLELIIQRLGRLYPDDFPRQVACLEQSIAMGWQGVFELNSERDADTTSNEVTAADIERMKKYV